jgi:hypothetical protein
MWAIWMFVILGLAGVVLLSIALAVGAAPLFAILIFLLVAAALGVVFVFRRGSAHGTERDAELAGEERSASGRGRPTTPHGPKPSGRPVAGEGGSTANGT